MARYDHLRLLRLPERFERRRQGGGRAPVRGDPGRHSRRLGNELDQAVQTQQRRRQPEFVDPSLILRVQMTGALLEDDWNQLGLTVLSSDDDRTLVLFSNTEDMTAFRERLAAFARGTQPGRRAPAYAAFIGGIEAIGSVEPRDRIGIRAREAGFTAPEDFQTGQSYTVDIELWDLGRRDLRVRTLDEVAAYSDARGGEELDRYVGPSISMVRLRCYGAVVRTLLAVDSLAEIDFPPTPDIATGEAIQLELAQLPPIGDVADDAPLIGIIDSGVNDHPLIADILVGAIGVPDTLGTADDFGHGTRVAGVATFGDLRAQLATATLDRGARLCSAKVVDDRGAFPDRRLTPRQMREAISRLNAEFGCRIFVIALGDSRRIYDGGKVGPWAATLDELARELNVVIIVSAGNRAPRSGNRIEQAVTEYPGYLTEPANRLCEPAGAMNVITVGSLAHGDGIGPHVADNVGVRPITLVNEPSPFTRVGPGLRGAIKPDVVDIGGTLIYDPVVMRLRGGEQLAEAGVLSLHYRYVDRLFAAGSGTSYSTPLVAFKAAQILGRFPDASANLVRTLLVGSTTVPSEARARLQLLGPDVERSICGHGVVDMERAAFSDDDRVVLYAEDELATDHFAVYQIPIPEAFQTERGRRTIRVSLAYDPPVRHTRRDYAGITMGFRLIRGCQSDLIFEHFRRRTVEEGRFPEMATRFNCGLEPGPTLREKSSLQTATATFQRDVSNYGDTYHLVVRCAGGWAEEIAVQAFALVVEIAHEGEVRLYERLRQQIRV
jgi:subtilisin family serine protease